MQLERSQDRMSETRARKAACLEDLRRRTLTQALEPGAYLDETQLAETYGMSRPPLREVLRQLSGEGYVTLHEGRGAQVTQMTHKTLRNFFMAAPMNYAATARLAVQFATRPQIMRLKDAQTLFRKAIRTGDTTERALSNDRFHATIGEMADNEYLLPSLRRLLIDHTRIAMTFYNPHDPSLTQQQALAADQHDGLIALIEAGDADGAADLAVAHWDLSRAEIERFVVPPGLQDTLGTGLSSKGAS